MSQPGWFSRKVTCDLNFPGKSWSSASNHWMYFPDDCKNPKFRAELEPY